MHSSDGGMFNDREVHSMLESAVKGKLNTSFVALFALFKDTNILSLYQVFGNYFEVSLQETF